MVHQTRITNSAVEGVKSKELEKMTEVLFHALDVFWLWLTYCLELLEADG